MLGRVESTLIEKESGSLHTGALGARLRAEGPGARPRQGELRLRLTGERQALVNMTRLGHRAYETLSISCRSSNS